MEKVIFTLILCVSFVCVVRIICEFILAIHTNNLMLTMEIEHEQKKGEAADEQNVDEPKQKD